MIGVVIKAFTSNGVNAGSFSVANGVDGASLDGACDEVARLTPGLHRTFDMNDLPLNTYTVDTRRMQLYSHPHVHPTVSYIIRIFTDYIIHLCPNRNEMGAFGRFSP